MAHNEDKLPMFKIVGHNVKKYRLMRRFTQDELAIYSRVTKNNIRRLEKLEGGCRFETLGRIAEMLKVDLTDLVTIPEENIDEYVDKRLPT